MCKEIFLYICNRLSTELERSDTVMQKPLSVQRRVAVCLWHLATLIEFLTIAHLFSITHSTVYNIVHETCRAIVKVLMKEHKKFLSGDDLDHVVDEFKTKWGVPLCLGAVDGCHIPICTPIEQHTDY